MYEFLESIKESAEVSKRELILGVTCGALAGVIVGIAIGMQKSRPPKAPKKIIIKEAPKTQESFVLNPEDYD